MICHDILTLVTDVFSAKCSVTRLASSLAAKAHGQFPDPVLHYIKNAHKQKKKELGRTLKRFEEAYMARPDLSA